MGSCKQLELYPLSDLIDEYGSDYVIENIIKSINNERLNELICNLALFYKGSASFEWLETQPITKLLILQREAVKINDKTKREINKSNSK